MKKPYVGATVLYRDYAGDDNPAFVRTVHPKESWQDGYEVDLNHVDICSVMHASRVAPKIDAEGSLPFWHWPEPAADEAEETAEPEPVECEHVETATTSLLDGRLIKICCSCFKVLEEEAKVEAAVLVKRTH